MPLSLEECRKFLDKYDLTDEQVLEIRDWLYSAVDMVLKDYFEGLGKK